MFVVTANRVGTEGPLTFTVMSLIADPLGQVLAVGPQEGPHTAVVPIDLRQAREKMISPRNHLIADRRPSEYAAMVAPPQE